MLCCPNIPQTFIEQQKRHKAFLRSKSTVNFENILIEHLTSMKVREILLNGPSSRIGLTNEEYDAIRQQVKEELKEDTNILSSPKSPTILNVRNGI